MNVITYSLMENSQVNSDQYYNNITIFTDEVLKEGRISLTPIVDSYHAHVNTSQHQDETILELLILGTLGRVYGKSALKLKKIQHQLLSRVSEIRQKNDRLKPGMNVLKGVMSTVFLSPSPHNDSTPPVQNLQQYNKLILWLEATGEFSNEVKRLRRWEGYLSTLPNKFTSEILKSVWTFANWFEERSAEVLGKYSVNVVDYLDDPKNKKYWREDMIFCNRRRVEYHLNMVGAEIMNRVFMNDFKNTAKKILLLPICITSPSKLKCQSEAYGNKFKCKGCSSKCQVKQLSKLGEKLGFQVMVVPHESSISSNGRKDALFAENTGVIGVACVLNLISGGWMLKDIGIPAQCVLLDYCGCKNHWDNKGIPTCINLNKLQEVIKKVDSC
ncbi:MAG: DUF116 domain-containing protein [Anaerobacillus sp.]|uniref:DUF116 domain-containing protein n=1 Tax=Anaerobacillus sp. TaxID=1872506 RepID=UPI00391B4775